MLHRGHLYFGVETWHIEQRDVRRGSAMLVGVVGMKEEMKILPASVIAAMSLSASGLCFSFGFFFF